MQTRRENTFLYLTNIIFFIYWTILLYFNRFSQDDYGFMSWVRNIGAIDFVSQVYNTFSGRFVRYFIYWCKFRLLGAVELPWLYPAFIYSLTVASILFIARKLSESPRIALIGILCYNMLIFCNLEFSAFFWTAAVDYYATAFLYPIWLLYFCFISKNRVVAYIGIIICSLLIGGGCEAHSPLFLYAIFCYFTYQAIFGSFNKGKERNTRLAIAFIIILAGFVIVCMAPGSSGRISMYTEKPSVSEMIRISFSSFAILAYLLTFRIPHLMILGIICFAAGRRSKALQKFKPHELIFSLICLLILMWISTFPAAYGMGQFGFHRIYTPVVSCIIISCAFWCYRLGQATINKTMPSAKYLAGAASLILCICIAVHIVVDTPTAKRYSIADKDRIALCLKEKEKGRTDDLFLDPLPTVKTYNFKSIVMGFIANSNIQPVLYYGNEIDNVIDETTDVGFANKCIINYYNLPFKIYRK